MPAVRIQHADAPRLAAIPDFYTGIARGEWHRIADLCARRLTDPASAGQSLQRLATQHTPTAPSRPQLTRHQDDAHTLTITGHLPALLDALDLYQRIDIGQWAQAAYVTLGEPLGTASRALLAARIEFQRPGAYPSHPAASWGIDRGSRGARLAYHVWKRLGGGTASRPTFSVGALLVETRD